MGLRIPVCSVISYVAFIFAARQHPAKRRYWWSKITILHWLEILDVSEQRKSRKPSWRNGKCATAVREWRLLAKKSTANQRKEHPKILSLGVTNIVPSLRGNVSVFPDETYPAKTREMALLKGENCIILTSTIFDWLACVTDRWTKRQTGDSI